jgi:hypothetical protein
MWNRFYSLRNSPIVWLISQLFVLLICIGYIYYLYLTNILPDKQAKESYQSTRCFLISKKLFSKGHLIHRYRADFLVSYNVKSVQYNRWVSGNGLDTKLTKDVAEQRDILSQYEVGRSYRCWYNPKFPQQSILVMRHNWFSTLPLVVPAAVCLIALYYLLKMMFHGIGQIKTRFRQSRDK